MITQKVYRIVDYLTDFYVQHQEVPEGARPIDEAWDEFLPIETDMTTRELAYILVGECVTLSERLFDREQLLRTKDEAIAALLKAGDAAQAEIKRLQGLLDTKHKPGFGLSKEQTDHLRNLIRNYGHACYNATDTEAKWRHIDDALHNYTKE